MADTATYSFSEITYFAFLPTVYPRLIRGIHLQSTRNLFYIRLSVARRRITAAIGAFPSKLGKITVDRGIKPARQTAARFVRQIRIRGKGGGGECAFCASGADLRSFFPPHLSNNANINPCLTMEFHLHLWTAARASEWRRASCNVTRSTRRVRNRRGEANARDGQRRSLKIESICALGLEIQIRREISMASPVHARTPSRVIYNR